MFLRSARGDTIIKITINVIIENFTEDVEPMKDKTFPRYWGSMPSARS
jgi:hypothetical protein